jgi:hypothetical protein
MQREEERECERGRGEEKESEGQRRVRDGGSSYNSRSSSIDGLGHGERVMRGLHHGHHIGLGHAPGLSMSRSCYV